MESNLSAAYCRSRTVSQSEEQPSISEIETTSVTTPSNSAAALNSTMQISSNSSLEPSSSVLSGVESQLSQISSKLLMLIRVSETKRLSIRSRILKGELEPQFLALEHKVVAAEHTRALEDLHADVQRLKTIATKEQEHKDNELKSQTEVFKEELFKEVVALLETEFSCVVCNEIFIQPSVIDCGHSFCSYCINQWKREKHECPICRKNIAICTKHVEMENFITKLHTMLSQDIQDRRKELVNERDNAVLSATGPVLRPVSGFPSELFTHEINGFYNDVRLFSREIDAIDGQELQNSPVILPGLSANGVQEFQSATHPPVTPPPGVAADTIPDRDARMRQFRLLSHATTNQQSSNLNNISPFASDEEDIDDIDEGAGEPAEQTGSASAYLVLNPVTQNLPVPLIFAHPTSPARNHVHGRCPFANSHGLNLQHHHSVPYQSYPYQFHQPGADIGNNHAIGYSGTYFHPQQRDQPLIFPHPQVAHANNRRINPIRQLANQVPPPAHQNSAANSGFFLARLRQPPPPQLSTSSTQIRPPNINVAFSVASTVVAHPQNYGFIPMMSPRESVNASVPFGIFPSQCYRYNPPQRIPLFTPAMYPVALPQTQTQSIYQSYIPQSHNHVAEGSGALNSHDANNESNTIGNAVFMRLGRRRRQESETETENNNNVELEPELFAENEDSPEVEILEEFPQEHESWGTPCTSNHVDDNYHAGMVETFPNDDGYDASNFQEDPYPQPPRRRRRNDHRTRSNYNDNFSAANLVDSQPTQSDNNQYCHHSGFYSPEDSEEF